MDFRNLSRLYQIATSRNQLFTRKDFADHGFGKECHLVYRVHFDDLSKKVLVGREKGIDVRLALDITRDVSEDTCDVVVIFSQDQDFSGVAKEVRYVSRRDGRWVKVASAFPVSSEHDNNSGINYTDWIRIDKKMYDECIDPKDHRLRGISDKDSAGDFLIFRSRYVYNFSAKVSFR